MICSQSLPFHSTSALNYVSPTCPAFTLTLSLILLSALELLTLLTHILSLTVVWDHHYDDFNGRRAPSHAFSVGVVLSEWNESLYAKRKNRA